jgi:hypothetical protein
MSTAAALVDVDFAASLEQLHRYHQAHRAGAKNCAAIFFFLNVSHVGISNSSGVGLRRFADS